MSPCPLGAQIASSSLTGRRAFCSLLLVLPVGCIGAYGRTSLPPSEALYERKLTHRLPPELAFARVESGLRSAFDDLSKVQKERDPRGRALRLASTVAYRTGGPTGPTRRSTYELQIIVREELVEMRFELGPEEETGHYAPESAIPYIRNDFDQIARALEKELERP